MYYNLEKFNIDNNKNIFTYQNASSSFLYI